MDHAYLNSLVDGYTALPELVQAIDLKSKPRQLTSLLDLEIKRRKEALRDLQAYRNFLAAPISVLPPEVLADIFHIYASVSNALFDLSWAKIMLVCQAWRRVGLSTASLWSCIDFDGVLRRPKRLTVQLQRSKGWPLDVKSHLYSTRNVHAYQDLADRELLPLDPGRIRSLDVQGGPKALAPFLEHVIPLTPTCPLLRELKIRFITTDGLGKEGVPLVEHLVSGGATSLSVLRLYNIAPPWGLLRGLTSLEVSGVTVGCETLLKSLSRCPALRLLDASLSTDGDAITTLDTDRIPLSSMQSLRLDSETMATCCYLLSRLAIPPDASISLPTLTTLDDLRSSRVFSLLRKHYQTNGALSMKTLVLRVRSRSDGEWQSVGINVFSYVNVERLFPNSYAQSIRETPYLSLCIADATPNHLRQALASILDALPVQELTHISLSIGDSLSKKTWKTILPMLPALTTLTLRADATASTAIEALDWFLSTKKRRPVSHLRLDCIYLTTVGRYTEDTQRNLSLAKDALRAALAHAHRAKALGQPLDVIELISGRLDPSASEVFQGVLKKNAYRLLATGFIMNEYTYNKEQSKAYHRTRRATLRRLGHNEKDWEPVSDSEVEAELDDEEAGSTMEHESATEQTACPQ